MATLEERLALLITQLGTDWKAMLQQLDNANVIITDPTNETVLEYEIQDDNSATASWPNRLGFYFKPFGGTRNLVFWLNEYFEPRVTAANDNTVALRIFGQNAAAPNTHTGWLFEIVDNRVDRVNKFGVDQDGNVNIAGDVSVVTVNGQTYYPIYPPGTTPASGDPTGLVVSTA